MYTCEKKKTDTERRASSGEGGCFPSFRSHQTPFKTRPNYATIWNASAKASGCTYCTNRKVCVEAWHNTWQCTADREDPDGLSKYHCKYWQLCLVPCLTPLIRLLPLHHSPFQSMLLFFSRSFLIAPSTPHPFILPLLSTPPSLCLSVRSDPNGQMSLFQTTSLSLDSGLSCFWRGWGQSDIKMHEEPYAGRGGRTVSSPEISPRITNRQKTHSLQPAQPLETTEQLQIQILIQDIFNSTQTHKALLTRRNATGLQLYGLR